MSNTLPPLAIPWTHRRNTSSSSNISLPPLSSWSDGCRALSSFSSSPPPSSSPPTTPFSARSTHNQAFIRSSSAFSSEMDHHPFDDQIDENMTSWDRSHPSYPANKPPNANMTLPSLKSIFPIDGPLSSFARSDASPSSKSAALFYHEHHSKHPINTGSRYDSVFCDSEEEEQEEDQGYSFVEENIRRTSFRTSSERGQWRYDPIPFKPEARPHLRQSAPTSSPPPISGLKLLSRPISEPAPSTARSTTPADRPDSHDDANISELPSSSYVDDPPSEHSSPTNYGATSSLPSLSSDRESMEPEEPACPSSPLPPSSPPCSPMSSPMMRSLSPLSFAPSSPLLPASSPLSFLSSLDHEDEDMELESDKEDPEMDTLPPIQREPSPVPLTEGPEDLEDMSTTDSSLVLQETSTTTAPLPIADKEPPASSFVQEHPSQSTSLGTQEPLIATTPPPAELLEVQPSDGGAVEGLTVEQVNSTGEVENMHISMPSTKGESKAKDAEVEAPKLKDKNGVNRSELKEENIRVRASLLKEKRKKKEEDVREGPVRKKCRLVKDTESANLSKRKDGSTKGTDREKSSSKKEGKRRLDDDEDKAEPGPTVPKPKKQKKNIPETTTSTSKRSRPQLQTSSTASGSRLSTVETESDLSSKYKPKSKPKPNVDPATQALHAEICGLVIESMATSRASCLPASSLYKAVMLSRPSLKAQRNETEWMEIIERVLHDGEASRGSGVFGKVESSGKDDSNRPLEAQWFYVPELDDDQDRAILIKSMMPRPGKRSETKKYKQYYYRPLGKISRWDPEDEI